MKKFHLFESPRIEIIIAALIAIASITFALTAWRTSMVSSSAGDANRQGMLDELKKQAAVNEDWRKTYEEANYAEAYAAFASEVDTMEKSSDATAAEQAANLRTYLLPNLQLLASPLASEEAYLKADGTFDLQKRFAALQDETPDLRDLDPEKSFTLAGKYYAEQRWLTAASVILALSLFWLALAEVSGKRFRMMALIIGSGVYAAGAAAATLTEAVFFFLRGGVL
jgi:hypothetical protein